MVCQSYIINILILKLEFECVKYYHFEILITFFKIKIYKKKTLLTNHKITLLPPSLIIDRLSILLKLSTNKAKRELPNIYFIMLPFIKLKQSSKHNEKLCY